MIVNDGGQRLSDKDEYEVEKQDISDVNVTPGKAGAVMRTLYGAKNESAAHEYRELHNNGDDVQRDAYGNIITWTPTKTAAYLDYLSEYDTQKNNKEKSTTNQSKSLFSGILPKDQYTDAVLQAQHEQHSAPLDSVPETNAEAFADALDDYARATARYDAAINNPNISPERAEALRQQKFDYQLSAMSDIQNADSRMRYEGVDGVSEEYANNQANAGTTSYELNQIANSRAERRAARADQKGYMKDFSVSSSSQLEDDRQLT